VTIRTVITTIAYINAFFSIIGALAILSWLPLVAVWSVITTFSFVALATAVENDGEVIEEIRQSLKELKS